MSMVVCGVYSDLCKVCWCMQCLEASIVYSEWLPGVFSADGVTVAW